MAPEQWRFEHATAATDIYALGIMAYEMLAGSRPFAGPDFREQHLHEIPATLQGVLAGTAALVAECLQKSPEARPPASDVARRLEASQGQPTRSGLGRLQQAHHDEVAQRASEQRRASQDETRRERHNRLFEDARRSFATIADALYDDFVQAAPSIVRTSTNRDLWVLQLGDATLRLSEPLRHSEPEGQLPFEVVAYAELSLEGRGSYDYRGRSHSLWYCDAAEMGRFSWYELAFMETLSGGGSTKPFALGPGEGAIAFSHVMGTKQLARSLYRLVPGELDDFIIRWGDWLAAAYAGTLSSPLQLPEETIVRNYRSAR